MTDTPRAVCLLQDWLHLRCEAWTYWWLSIPVLMILIGVGVATINFGLEAPGIVKAWLARRERK